MQKNKRKIGTYVADRLYFNNNGVKKTYEVTLDLDKDLTIHDLNLKKDMQEHASRLGFYIKLREEAEYAMKLSKNEWLSVAEEVSDEIRREEDEDELPASRRLTESSLKRRTNLNPQVRDAIDEYMYKASQYRTLNGFVLAMTERGRMLQSMNKRQSDERHQTP